MILQRAANHEIEKRGTVAVVRIWSRPDLSPDDGARLAGEMMDALRVQVFPQESTFTGFIFDVREGPPAFGPKTRTHLEALFRDAAKVRQRIGVIVGDSAIQRLQFSSLTQPLPDLAGVFHDESAALAWCSTVPGG